MAVDSLDDHVRVNAEQFALPLLNQMGRTHHERHLIRTDVVSQRLDRAGSNCHRDRAALSRFSNTHLTHQQDAIAPLKALRDRRDDVLLRRIEWILALQPHAIQEATDAVHVELVGRRELVVEIGCQRPLVAGNKLQQSVVTVHLDQRAVVG